MTDDWDEVIFACTRAQALDRGVLVDVSTTATEAGIRYPVALTRAVHDRCVKVPQGALGQDEAGRLWDILMMYRFAAPGARGSELLYGLHVRSDNRPGTPPLVTLKAVCGPGDRGEPVITIMLPDES